MSAIALVELLKSMAGQEPDKMSAAEAESFRNVMLERFRHATAFVSETANDVAGEYTSNLMPAVVKSHSSDTSDWLGYYALEETTRLDAFLEAPPLVQRAASLWSPIAMKLHLFAEAHHPGYSHFPHVELAVECTYDPAMALFETAVEMMNEDLQRLCAAAVSCSVASHEGAMVNIENPPDLASAVRFAASAVRRESEKNNDGFMETMEIKINFDATTPLEIIEETVRLGVFLFYSVSKVLSKER